MKLKKVTEKILIFQNHLKKLSKYAKMKMHLWLKNAIFEF